LPLLPHPKGPKKGRWGGEGGCRLSTDVARTLKLTLAYDGAGFVGWQRQAEGQSIQGLIEEALSKIEHGPVTLIGAGRTDAGVHAIGQVASVALESAIDCAAIRRALNAMLPPEVRVHGVEEAPAGFHARYSAHSKTYRYWIANGDVAHPFLWRYVWLLSHPLDVVAMAEAACLVEGQRDFAGFQGTGSSTESTVRTVFTSLFREATQADLWAGSGSPAGPRLEAPAPGTARLLLYEVTGDGFLRHMVRNIVGTLAEIGIGRRRVDAIPHILSSGDRRLAGPTAPACGLCLVRVGYGEYGPALATPAGHL
jgi:tRNA pseudouridine38-40 synthase